jgi:hypothetical protein
MTEMRLISHSGVSLAAVEAAAHSVGTSVGWTWRAIPPGEYAELSIDGQVYATLEISRHGDELFHDELADLREPIEWFSDTPRKARVLETLDQAQALLLLTVVWPDLEDNALLDATDDLFDALLSADPHALLQISEQGYYDLKGQVLKF